MSKVKLDLTPYKICKKVTMLQGLGLVILAASVIIILYRL